MLWWSAPKQRQRWGDNHVLPSSNWGNIFFDLFYVGGAYNLGMLIKTSNDDYYRGILYFCGAGFPIMMMWFDKMYYDARFTTRPGHDACHRTFEVLHLLVVATALSRIRSVDVMSHPSEHIDMFQFSLSLLTSSLMTVYRYIEVMRNVIGDLPAAKVAAQRDIIWRLIPAIWFMAATIESGYYFYNNKGDGNNNNVVLDRPIWYCLVGWILWVAFGFFEQVVFAPEKIRRDISVPMNVHFCMHRYGEWFMLMFGESIISLLIVDSDNESGNYSLAFYSGILSVIFLAHLHYGSEPHNVDDHALSRSRYSNYVYTVMVPIYSAALIAIGVSYKLFMYEFIYLAKSNYKNYSRNLGGGGGGDDDAAVASTTYDDGDEDAYMEARQQFAADLFSCSMATAFLCSDFFVLLHKGVHNVACGDQGSRGVLPKLTVRTILIVLRISLIVLLASLSSFQNDPHVMAFCGLGAILAKEILRDIEFMFFQRAGDDKSKSSHDEKDDDIDDHSNNNNTDSYKNKKKKTKDGHGVDVGCFDHVTFFRNLHSDKSHKDDDTCATVCDSIIDDHYLDDDNDRCKFVLAKFEQEEEMLDKSIEGSISDDEEASNNTCSKEGNGNESTTNYSRLGEF